MKKAELALVLHGLRFRARKYTLFCMACACKDARIKCTPPPALFDVNCAQ